MIFFYFSLAPHIYAAKFDNSVIILDTLADKYISLIDNAAEYFCAILSNKFTKNKNDLYCPNNLNEDPDKYNYWILYFIEKKFIINGIDTTNIASPLQEGGLINYRWDLKKSWHQFSQTPIKYTIQALFILAKVHRSIKRNGMQKILDLISKYSNNKNLNEPSELEIQKLSAAVDAALLIYPKETVCFPWAATYVLLALKNNWKMQLVLGIQTNPFYAHAWAQASNGNVINDDPVVARVLSVIFKHPNI